MMAADQMMVVHIVVVVRKIAARKAVERKVAAHKVVERKAVVHRDFERKTAVHIDHMVVACLVVHRMGAYHMAVDQTFRPSAVARIVPPFQSCRRVFSWGRMVKPQTLCS